MKSVPMFATALPMKIFSVLIHLDLVYFLSQNPLTGLHVKIPHSIQAIAQAITMAVTMFAANLNFGTAKIRRYRESIDSLMKAMLLT